MNKVYQHGDELFVTLDATPRMRNLRTGLTITPRVPFKYLGEMPQVGQVWEAKRSGRVKHILGVEGARVRIRIPEGLEGTVPVAVFIKNHTLRPEPNFHFATGTPEPLNSKADVEASDSLVICRNDNCYLVYKKGPTKCPYCCGKQLPLPGQLWAKGSRYVKVDRVEDGRVYYTDGSSGLRRFLNEYANVTKTVGERNREKLSRDHRLAASAERGRKILSGMAHPLCRPCHDFKLEELARGYGGFTPTGRIKTEPEMQPFPNRPIGTVAPPHKDHYVQNKR